MSLRTAALLAFLGTLLLTLLEAFRFVRDVSAAANGVVASADVLSSAIRLFAAATLALFFYAYQRKQS